MCVQEGPYLNFGLMSPRLQPKEVARAPFDAYVASLHGRLEARPYVVGRHEECDLVAPLSDLVLNISRRQWHFFTSKDGKRVFLTDKAVPTALKKTGASHSRPQAGKLETGGYGGGSTELKQGDVVSSVSHLHAVADLDWSLFDKLSDPKTSLPGTLPTAPKDASGFAFSRRIINHFWPSFTTIKWFRISVTAKKFAVFGFEKKLVGGVGAWLITVGGTIRMGALRTAAGDRPRTGKLFFSW